jgi:hypothetical protein
MKKQEVTHDLKNEIREMAVGQRLSFPMDRLAVVRTYASEIGFVLNRRYKTFADKETRSVVVTRVE